jgi:hypothetical protein
MVRIFVFFITVMTLALPAAWAETTPEEILEAVEEMTPEQVHELETTLASRKWEPVPGSFFDRIALKFSVVGARMDDLDLSSVNLSAGHDLDLEAVSGNELSVLWQLFDKRFRAGFKFAVMAAEDSHMDNNGYSSAELFQTTSTIAVNYQLVRTDAFIWWTEAAVGGSYTELELLDTPLGSASTIRRYDKTYGQGELSTGFDWRFNPVLSLSCFIGYQNAEDVKLEEGGRETGIEFDPKGYKGGVGLTYNF